MRLEIRFDSKHAAAAAVGTQRCSSNTEFAHKIRHHWQCVNENTFGGVAMKGDPWNELPGCRGSDLGTCCDAAKV